jgi:hypothetical protein
MIRNMRIGGRAGARRSAAKAIKLLISDSVDKVLKAVTWSSRPG